MLCSKRRLMQNSVFAAIVFSIVHTYLFTEQNVSVSTQANSYQHNEPTSGAACRGGSCPLAGKEQQGSCQGGSCQGGSCQAGNCQNGSCQAGQGSCQDGGCQGSNCQGGNCQNGRCCHDHYGTHYGEQNGWHYPRPDYPGCPGGSGCSGNHGQCNGNSAYGENCQSGCCNIAHRPDQYNVNYNGYPYDCSYYNYSYPYDGSYYYSVHPWLDGF